MNEAKPKRDPEGTRRRILQAAIQQFSTFGLSGARVDVIATAADTNERMLYYYSTSRSWRQCMRNSRVMRSNRFTLKAFVRRDYTEPSVVDAVTEMQDKMLIAYLQPAPRAVSP